MELGNTLVAKYAAAGALEDISGKKSQLRQLRHLAAVPDGLLHATSGKLYCVPYYAGSRAIIYRKDMFDAAGVQPSRPAWTTS